MEDTKKENIELKKKAALVETLKKQSSVSHKRNSELVSEKNQLETDLQELKSKQISIESIGKDNVENSKKLESMRYKLSMADRMNDFLQREIRMIKNNNKFIEDKYRLLRKNYEKGNIEFKELRRRYIRYEEDNRNLRLNIMQGKKSINVKKCSGIDVNQQEYRIWRPNETNNTSVDSHNYRANETNNTSLDSHNNVRDNVSQHTVEEKEEDEIKLTRVDLTFPQTYKVVANSNGAKDVLVIGMTYNRTLLDTMFMTIRNKTMAVLHKKLDTTITRDMIRCRVMESCFKLNIMETITLNTVTNSPCEGHHYMNVTNKRSIQSFATNNANRYDYVYIDYYRSNDNYYGTKLLNTQFFGVTLSHMHRMLKLKGKVILPFFPRVVANMVPELHKLAKMFNITYLKKNELHDSENYLWRATEMITKIKDLKHIMTGEKSVKKCFGNVNKKIIKAFVADSTCNDSVDLFCDNIPEIENIFLYSWKNIQVTIRTVSPWETKGK